jgi:vacuolar-type H+-ATPase subunit F/Vma7
MNFDARGIPGVSIVTTGFTDAVASQSKALGFDPAVLFVPHPIQNRTPDELKKIADDAVESAIGMLTSPAGNR